jgi:hypothetical protein
MTIEEIKEYIFSEGLAVKSRKREVVYRRIYLFRYLKQMEGMSLISIGKMFNRDHSTVIHGLRTFDNVKLYEDFMDYTRKEFELFKINTFRRDLYTLNRTPIQFSREQFETIVEVRINENIETNEEAIKFIIESYERRSDSSMQSKT